MITVNGKQLDAKDLSIEALLTDLAIETRGVAVAINGEIVRRGEWTSVTIVSGDRVEIVSAAAGGL
ncbi:MAG TPA: sulfur carrier protein ThiS [Acidimicrobiales bacterium]